MQTSHPGTGLHSPMGRNGKSKIGSTSSSALTKTAYLILSRCGNANYLTHSLHGRRHTSPLGTTYAKAPKGERYHYRFLLSGAGVQANVPSGCTSTSALDKLEETSLVKPRNEGSAQEANSTKIPQWGARTSSGFPRWLSPNDHHKDRVVRAELTNKKDSQWNHASSLLATLAH